MKKSSRIPGFYTLSPDQRREAIQAMADLSEGDVEALDAQALSLEAADLMVENVIGTFSLPLGVGLNFLINGEDVVVPMALEEPSVVAAASNMARIVRQAGGFTADCDPSEMVGQVQLTNVEDPAATIAQIEAARPELDALAASVHPQLETFGGGYRGMSARVVTYDEPSEVVERMVVVEFVLDCADAMGANMINTLAERLAPELTRITGEKVGLRILSNLAHRRLARASCTVPAELLSGPDLDGAEVVRGIASAYRFAWADPWRAATHNKGIMNGIDPVIIATGNDWRAIEAGAHAWAARDGRYRSLSRWTVDEQDQLHGSIELPMQVGTVGGTLKSHPTAAASMKILGNPGAQKLAGIIATVGLAQNMGALRALATEGIQRGHMRMHARHIAAEVGATGAEVHQVVSALCDSGEFTEAQARAALAEIRR
jgi:hydroxymethylglutaryl-CoA reductase